MPTRQVHSKQNARLKELRRALAAPGRDPLAAIEGPILISEASRAGLRIHCLFAAEETEPLLATLSFRPETEILLLPRQLLNAALSTENPQPVAALVTPPAWTWEQMFVSARPPLLLVLAAVQDPGNLGAILRSAEAFGATGVLALPGTVSEWNPKAIRASAGSLFRLPLLHATAEEAMPRLRAGGIRILAATARQAQPVSSIDLAPPTAFLIGNEGNGIPPELEREAAAAVTIPCPGPVESLNAAVAASVLLYEASRQRTHSPAG